MKVSFELEDQCAVLMQRAADRIALQTGKPMDISAIAKSLVLEVLIDDAYLNGELQAAETSH
jgi:hypothetical protein